MHFDVDCNVRLTKDIEIRASKVKGQEPYGFMTVLHERKSSKGSISKTVTFNVFCSQHTAQYLIDRGYGQGDTVQIRGQFIAENLVDNSGKIIGYKCHINVPAQKGYRIDGGVLQLGKYAGCIQADNKHNEAKIQAEHHQQSIDILNQAAQQKQMAISMPPQNTVRPFAEIRAEVTAPDNFDDEDIEID